MTVLLVLITFLGFALVDYFLNRHKVPVPRAVLDLERPTPTYIDGFLVPEGLRYHPGHTWLVRERPHFARVGVDEFAAKLAVGLTICSAPAAITTAVSTPSLFAIQAMYIPPLR